MIKTLKDYATCVGITFWALRESQLVPTTLANKGQQQQSNAYL
jgi:hypothetical protein